MEYFQTKFGVCFSIKITHPYFDDGVCPYLSIEPDALTKRLLTQCRFITKVSAGYAKIIATGSGEIENGEAKQENKEDKSKGRQERTQNEEKKK